MATGPRLSIHIAEKRFGGADPLFQNFNLEVEPSTVVAILGPSGIGKSSLLRLIAGIDHNYRGTITIGSTAAADAPPPGFVFQDPRLLPWLTARDNIRAANPHCTAKQAQAALVQVGLDGQGALYPHQLSGGMQRRVALARALCVNGQLLLLDEPFVSLDRQLVEDMHRLFLRLVDERRPTVVFSTHLIDDAARLADRVIIFGGRPVTIMADISLPDRTCRQIPAIMSLLGAELHNNTRALSSR